jgi:serine/threonine protein kinase
MIGKEISHYKILERIGGGGMGVVYKAEDTKLKRPVALKFLPPAFATDSTTKERFIHEAQAASALQHNNICAIHEIDETDDGQMYIVMDCYEGETLKKKLENGKLDVDDAIDIIVQIAEGLKKAHAKGIIHRDTKPGNIIITEDGVAKILDFGLAKFRGQTKITKSGSTVGTVAYMSPEQARGEAVDHRTDIWSLGVILYEMVSGELPFKGDYDQAVVYSILNEKPESLNIEIPDALKTIIEKCLEKNPSDRYQDISYLLVDLKSTKDGSSTVHSGQQAKKIKLKPMVFTIAVLVFIVIGYLYIPFDIFIKTSDGAFEWENSIGILPFDNISNDPEQDYFCEGMTEQIISNLSRLPTLKVIARQSMMKYKDTDKTISEIGEELDVAYVLEGSFRKFEDRIRVTAQLISTKDDFHVWSEDYDREYTELLELQDDVSATIAGSLLKTISGNDRIDAEVMINIIHNLFLS